MEILQKKRNGVKNLKKYKIYAYILIVVFIILIISSLIVLYGLINSVDTIRDAYIIFYTTIIMIFICALIVNKNIHKRIPKQKKNKDKNK